MKVNIVRYVGTYEIEASNNLYLSITVGETFLKELLRGTGARIPKYAKEITGELTFKPTKLRAAKPVGEE